MLMRNFMHIALISIIMLTFVIIFCMLLYMFISIPHANVLIMRIILTSMIMLMIMLMIIMLIMIIMLTAISASVRVFSLL